MGKDDLLYFDLALELGNHLIFVIPLHATQVDMPLDLGIILIWLLDPIILLLDSEGHLISLKLVLSDSLIQFATLALHTISSLRLIFLDLLNASLTRLHTQLALGECP